MKIYCTKCGNRLKSEICKKCGSDNSVYYRTEKYSKSSTWELLAPWLLVMIILAAFLGTCVSCTVCPEAWSASVKENRAAILEYANANYPGAKIVEEYYPSATAFATGNPYDSILFELDGIEFSIRARQGKVGEYNDGCGERAFRKEIREKYPDTFFLPRGLTYNAKIYFSDQWVQRNDDLYSFKGGIHPKFEPEYDENIKSPRDLGWFYDFYCYWRDVCPVKRFTLRFYYFTDSQTKYLIYCDTGYELTNEDEFYGLAERLPE